MKLFKVKYLEYVKQKAPGGSFWDTRIRLTSLQAAKCGASNLVVYGKL